MKKITLINKEAVIHKVRFSTRIFLIDLLFLALILTLTSKLKTSNIGSFITIFLLIIFIPLLFKTLLDIYRIIFHRVYISNYRVIYVKGLYFKTIKYFDIKDITGVYFKSSRFDKAKNMTTFKCTLTNEKYFILKNVKNGAYIAQLLSVNLIKMHKNKKGQA